MPIILTRRLNHRLIVLDTRTRGQTVGVLTRSGHYRYVRWLGFIERSEADQRGRPVRLEITRIGRQDHNGTQWQEVPSGRHVQGCLTGDGAYAVVDEAVKLV